MTGEQSDGKTRLSQIDHLQSTARMVLGEMPEREHGMRVKFPTEKRVLRPTKIASLSLNGRYRRTPTHIGDAKSDASRTLGDMASEPEPPTGLDAIPVSVRTQIPAAHPRVTLASPSAPADFSSLLHLIR